MKTDKVGKNSYRVRKMYQSKVYTMYFTSKPSEKEIMVKLAELIEQDNRTLKGTFKECAEKYIENRSSVLSPASMRTYENYIKVMSNTFLQKDMFQLTQEDIQKEINRYAETHSPKTVRSLHGFIASVIIKNRSDLHLTTTLPQKVVSSRFAPKHLDISRLLTEIKNDDDSIGIQLGILGLRRGEICALTMDDLSGNKLTVSKTLVYYNKQWIVKQTPKTDASNRTIVLPDSLVKQIQAHNGFFNYSPKKLNEHLHTYQDKLGIERFRFHDLRGYFASYCHSVLGLCDEDIMYLGGWKTDNVMKNIYRKAMEESVEKSMEKVVDKIFCQ